MRIKLKVGNFIMTDDYSHVRFNKYGCIELFEAKNRTSDGICLSYFLVSI